ncbi:hypothetical protein BDW75DRAFT_221062 [Aspergillus navahoensis]
MRRGSSVGSSLGDKEQRKDFAPIERIRGRLFRCLDQGPESKHCKTQKSQSAATKGWSFQLRNISRSRCC